MFHRQKSDQENDQDQGSNTQNPENVTNAGNAGHQSGAELSTSNQSSGTDLQAEQSTGQAPDVSIPPSAGQSAQKRIGVRIAGDNQNQQATRPSSSFSGFNRLHVPAEEQSPQDVSKENLQTQTEQKDQTVEQQQQTVQQHQPQTQTQQSSGPATSVSEGRQLLVGEGISLTGEIQECNHLVVEGRVEAALRGSKVLEIKENGTFIGAVEIEQATIAGVFEGEITVNGRLTITETGAITGTVSYKELEIQAGAKLDGRISPIGGSSFKTSETENKQGSSSSQESGDSQKAKSQKQGNKNESSKKKDAELPLSEDA